MRERWRLPAAALAVGVAGALAIVASSHAAITITSLRALASGSSITSGPMGSGYDIRIVANVTGGTTWQSTSWTTGGVTRCVNHTDRGDGSQTVDLKYEYEANAAIKAAERRGRENLPDPDKVGPSEHVFTPPPGGPSTVRIDLFTNNSCSGTALATGNLNLTTKVPATNNPLTAACQGLKIAVVLDESGSIASAGATQEVRDATKALARGLLDTGATMAVFKFSTTASTSQIDPYQNITQTFINGQLTTYLNNYQPGGTTNWDAGLERARSQTSANPPHLVVFLTDGNPNRWAGGGTGVEEGFYSAMDPAANRANQLKATSHMFAIGVGDGVTDALSALRIQAVSGTRSFPEYPIETADYTLVTDFDDLEDALAGLASKLCNLTVTVRKETDEAKRDAWVSKSGWRFSGRTVLQSPASQFDYRWFLPGQAGPPVNDTTATQSGNTAAAGTLDFVWRPNSATALSNITISETPVPAEFEAESVTCTSSAGTPIFDSDVQATVESFTLTGLKVRDHVNCVVRNRLKRSTVTVVKQWDGDPSSTTIFVDATGDPTYDASTVATTSGASASHDYPVSTGVTVGEIPVPLGYTATIQCGDGPVQNYPGGPFAVMSPPTDGDTVTCTITNKQLRSTVQVLKNWVGTPSSTTIFVDRNGDASFDASIVATASGVSTSFSYPVSTPVFVGEVAPVPAGYEATIQCGGGTAQAYTGGPHPVTSPATDGGIITCTITNKQKTSTVRVVKAWVGDPSTTTIFVDQDGVGPVGDFDAETVATETGDDAQFTYPISTPVTVGETPVPAGYAATIACGEETAQPYSGAPHPVTSPDVGGSTITCTITNTQLLSHVRVVKEWVGDPSTTTIFVDQDGVGPDFDAETIADSSGDSASFTYPISTPVTVGEVVPVPTGYAATIQCGTGGAPGAYTGGPFAVTSPATDGATITCTIVNTQQLSKVRVIKNWSGTPSTATIFVDQDGVGPDFDAETVAIADGDSAEFEYPVSTPAFVGEIAVPTGYTATIQCGAGPVVDPYNGGNFAVTSPPTNGDTLTCTISNNIIPPPATVRVVKEWIGDPSSATIFVDQDGVGPDFDAETVATADGDNASFDYTAGTAVTVGETAVPTGYDATIQCGANRAVPYQGGPFAAVAPAAGETLTCTITNRQLLSTVRVVKQWVGAPSSATIFVDQDGVGPDFDASTTATASGDTTSFVYPVSTPVTVGETTVPVGYQATISCGELQGRQQYTGGPFPVTSPAQHLGVVTCTITNTQKLSFVRTVKQWVGATSSAEIFVDLNGAAPYDASTTAIASGDNTSFRYPTSTPVTVGETTVPAGYGAEIACGHTQPRQPYDGGPFPVVSPAQHLGVVTCTVTNSQLFSTVQVVKQWIGTPASTTVFVDAAAPLCSESTVATASGDSASCTYPVSTPVTVGEDPVPAGYAATIDCGQGPQPYTGGPFPVTSPAEGDEVTTCTITNTELRSTMQVVKEWAGASSAATLFVDVNGMAPYDASRVATASGQGTSFEYPVSTPVAVGETTVPAGFTAAIDCGGGRQAYAGGPFPVTSPAVDGATITCTITNTPVTTVRLLKEWGGAERSATIFVDEAGSAPFDVASVATADGQSVSFDYPPSTQVTIGEIRVPQGYVAFINCGTGPHDLRLYRGGPFTVTSPSTPGGVLTCTVTNARRLGPLARLVIRKRADRHLLYPLQRVTFRITVRNRGRGTARNVVACDRMPAGLTVVRAPGARRSGRNLCWRVATMRPNARKTFVVVARVGPSSRRRAIVNPADVSGSNTANCRRPDISRRLPACRDRARVLVRGRPVVRVPFTG